MCNFVVDDVFTKKHLGQINFGLILMILKKMAYIGSPYDLM
jgi:hypothetical protein